MIDYEILQDIITDHELCKTQECEDCIYSLLQINSFKVSSIQHVARIMGQFGKTIFLTKEEAEKALAELKR